MRVPSRTGWAVALAATFAFAVVLSAQPPAQTKKDEPKKEKAKAKAKAKAKEKNPNDFSDQFPPKLPDGKEVVTDTSDVFLKRPATLKDDVEVAKTAPTIDFLFLPGQTYPGKPWSNWGDGVAANGKYYSAVGDHLAPGGNAFVFEYDPAKKAVRKLVDVRQVLNLPDGHYTPGKIHSRIDIGSDGKLYFATHRGSINVTTDQYHYTGDWIFRCDPATGKTEVVAHGIIPKHAIPNSVLDPDRLIFYGGTAAGKDEKNQGIQFFAYDVKNHKLLYSGPDGPARYMIFAKSTGRVYYNPGNGTEAGGLMRYDPAKGGAPVKIPGSIGIRSATQETPQGFVYTASQGQGATAVAHIYSFNTKTEEATDLGPAAVAGNTYIASIDADPTGRYLYYVPGAHGGGDRDGTAVVQFDTKTRKKKVIAFLHPFYHDKYKATPVGTYSTAVDPAGDKLYITWNVNRGGRAWDCTAITCIHIPASERQP
jgi:hypothetical protein